MIEFTIILGGILLRLAPHVPNFSSISATALFAGSKLKKRYAFILPLVAMMISDYLVLYVNPFQAPFFNFSQVQPLTTMFHSTTMFVWGSFMLSGLIGLWLRKNPRTSNILTASLLASIQFFIITNFGVWAMGAYNRGLDGLLTSYAMGLPFLRWTLLGDLFYTSVFFGTYALATKAKKLSFSPAKTQ